jgi:hypothetical protein
MGSPVFDPERSSFSILLLLLSPSRRTDIPIAPHNWPQPLPSTSPTMHHSLNNTTTNVHIHCSKIYLSFNLYYMFRPSQRNFQGYNTTLQKGPQDHYIIFQYSLLSLKMTEKAETCSSG